MQCVSLKMDTKIKKKRKINDNDYIWEKCGKRKQQHQQQQIVPNNMILKMNFINFTFHNSLSLSVLYWSYLLFYHSSRAYVTVRTVYLFCYANHTLSKTITYRHFLLFYRILCVSFLASFSFFFWGVFLDFFFFIHSFSLC